ncbi:MAG TPA: PPC domain-containing protein [Pyrinomonadaceae bacterium]|nr:PPC domain-containing protein [Pyrinomonadaceae bacterium]
MKNRKFWLALGCVAFVLMASFRGYAGGPLALRAAGAPYLWPGGGVNIPFNPDQGGLGILNNAAAVGQTTSAFAVWQAIPSATATHVNAGQLAFDVDETNYLPFLNPVAPDGLSAIVYDEDGAIFDELFGANSGVLGFAGPEWVNTSTGDILEGVAFLNGATVTVPADIPVMLAVQVHEYGHYQNLAHSVVNGQMLAFGDNSGPTPNDTFPGGPGAALGNVETMYPFLFNNDAGGAATVHADDIAIFSHLYPAPTFASSTGAISGTILLPNNTTPATGVNVIARNVANPYLDAVSAISSDFATDYTPGQPFVGAYALRGLTPGASYAVFVDEIIQGGFSTPPLIPLPAPEEFYNGALESNNGATDDPSVFTAVVPGAGSNVMGIDIIFNRLAPGPIPAGDDTTHEIFPSFPLKMCGQTFNSFFVNSNGSVTFGAGDPDFSETTAEHLTGPPRIAGLWDDLNASAGGTLSWSENSNSVTITFSNVPEFINTGSNSFSITIEKPHGNGNGNGNTGRFTLSYGNLSALDGLAGYSCGGRITSGFELEQDLSAKHGNINGHHDTAIFENFSTNDNDLDNRSFTFLGTKLFTDEFEGNNSAGSAQAVSLPFNTSGKFSEIRPLGNDVDFYRFNVSAGDIVAIETVPGLQTMDTIIGLFDSGGNLLLADDDGGVGLLSRLLVQFNVAGTYSVAVSTFDDFDFNGDGTDFGRYVLNISSYRGTVLPLTDDESAQVNLNTFAFPYQGVNRSSVFVNANGNLTFGVGNGDFSETVPEFLNGPPRIAPLWDDLFPGNGLVIAEEKNQELHVHFVSVSEFIGTGTNYFSVILDKKGEINMNYLATNRSDAIVGVTQGGGAADPGPTDLSNTNNLSAAGTRYEQFFGSFAAYGGTDLSFRSLRFKKP